MEPGRHKDRFLEMLAAESGAANNTLIAYNADLSALFDYLLQRGLTAENCRKIDVAEFLAMLAQLGLSPRTQKRKLSVFRQFFLFLLREGVRQENPASDLHAPQTARPLPKSLSEGEIERLINVSGELTGVIGFRARAGLEILYATGLRISEMLNLSSSALSTGSEFILIKGKGGKERVVPLSMAAKQAAKQFREQTNKSPYLFAGRKPNSKMTIQGFSRLLKRVAQKADIDSRRVSPHVLRHSFASHLLARGADLRSIQLLLGHADLTTTQIYTKVLGDRLQNLMEASHPLAPKSLN